MKIVNTVLERLSENSTWRGIILVATALGVKLDPSMQEGILALDSSISSAKTKNKC